MRRATIEQDAVLVATRSHEFQTRIPHLGAVAVLNQDKCVFRKVRLATFEPGDEIAARGRLQAAEADRVPRLRQETPKVDAMQFVLR